MINQRNSVKMLNHSVTLFAVILLVLSSVNLKSADATCEHRNEHSINGEQFAMQTTKEKFKDFFVGVGCGIQSGARSVTQKIKSGYSYLKNKVMPTKPPGTDTDVGSVASVTQPSTSSTGGVDPLIDVRFGNSREAIIEQRFRRYARFNQAS